MSKKSLIVLIATITLIAAIFSGCGGNSNTVKEPTSNSPVTLTYGIWDNVQQPVYQKLADEYHKQNPNVTIKIELTPWEQYWTKLDTAATGGTVQDLFWMDMPHSIVYESNGILKDISSNIKNDNVDMNNFPEQSANAFKYDGKTYGIPKDVDTIALWYNKKIFDDAKLPYPDDTWNWDKMHSVAKQLTDAKKGIYGFAAFYDPQIGIYNTIFQAGGEVVSKDKKTSLLDTPEAIEGIKFWTQFFTDKSTPTVQQMTDTDPTQMYQNGKIAMIFGGSWLQSTFLTDENAKKFAEVALLPQGKQRGVVTHSVANVISSKTQHPKEAWGFLKYLSSKDANQIVAESGQVIPAFKGTTDAWVKSNQSFKLQVFVDELSYAHAYPITQNTSGWESKCLDIFPKAFAGQMTAAQACKTAAEEMNKVLSEK